MDEASGFTNHMLHTNFNLFRVSSQNGTERAVVPPRGWNSYNSFSWIISEEEYLKNAEVVANRLKSKGYEVGLW